MKRNDKTTMNAKARPKARMGRPPTVGTGETVVATVRLTPEQGAAIRKAAKKNHQQRSEWIRNVLFIAAQAA